MLKKSVLIVEDEELMREVIKDYFKAAGYEICEASSGTEAVELNEYRDFDIILLDIMLPGLDGYSVCRAVRRTKATPIIMITARSDEDDKLIGYDVGADDYVTKPFSPKVLLAKANALIKRTEGSVCATHGTVAAAGIVINEDSHTVTVDNEYIDLSPKEYDLLLFLMQNKGRVLTRDTLLSRIWGYDYFGDLRTVDTHIKKLRSKLGVKASHIKTLIKAGYKFDESLNE